MPLKIRKNKSPLFIILLLILTLLTGLTAGYFSAHGITENGKFEAFSRKVFQNEVSGSTLTLHYTLAHPEKQGIPRKKASLGTVPTDMKNTYQICSQYEEKLKSFRYSRLSTENQLTLDSMLLYYHTEKSLGDNYLLQEPLGPSLGIQAQLPVLLAEYAFYENQDITDYLNLLTTIRPYFQSILKFEKKKSEAGFFMSDTTLDRVLAQCSAFIQNPDNSYMLNIFQKKPYIEPERCIRCGICVKSCPVPEKAIDFRKGRENPPVYDYKKCIRCFCCQEMCPEKAIHVK